ncbi:MAG: hypothetical protein IK115_01515 [Lachnospiraceae bacterium]|nr:hypothetical protein [Lachnospiraceae bacterium]
MRKKNLWYRVLAMLLSFTLLLPVTGCGFGRDAQEEEEEEEDDEDDKKDKKDKKKDKEDKEETEVKEEKPEATPAEEPDSGKKQGKVKETKKDSDDSGKKTDNGAIEGYYTAVMELGEEYLKSQMDEELAEIFDGVKFDLFVNLDLKTGGSGELSFDIEKFYDDVLQWMDENYYTVVEVVMKQQGISEKDLEKEAKDMGYKDVYEYLDLMKPTVMEAMKQGMGDVDPDEYTYEVSWKQDGKKLILNSADGKGEDLECSIRTDGAISLVIDEEDSPMGCDMELLFTK